MIQTAVVIIIVALAAIGLWRSLRRKAVKGDNCCQCPLQQNCSKKQQNSCTKQK